MEEFPFTAEEWDRVGDMSRAIVNASYAEDEILGAAHTAEMHALLDDLEAIYGEHPILIETHADYTSERGERL